MFVAGILSVFVAAGISTGMYYHSAVLIGLMVVLAYHSFKKTGVNK